MEFSFIPVHYLYNYYMVCALFSHAPHVTWLCDVTLSYTSYIVSPKEKKKKGNINNNLAVLLGHDNTLHKSSRTRENTGFQK